MKTESVEIQNAEGRTLSATIYRPEGKKFLAKGHMICDEDILLLEDEGIAQVLVIELEPGEIHEGEAAFEVAAKCCCGSVQLRVVSGGRTNLVATEDCCVLVDGDLLKQINCAASIVIATSLNFSFAKAGTRITTVKSAPFAVAQAQLEAVMSILTERGPILQARPIRNPQLGVLYSDPISGDRARQLFESIMRQRLEKFGIAPSFVLNAVEDETSVARALNHLLRAGCTAVLIASTTAPAGPEDVVGRAMTRIECHIEKFMAPVEPGNLLMLAYKDEVPILSAPGCFRSAKANVVDLVLPPMLSRYRISDWEIAALGHGGLLG